MHIVSMRGYECYNSRGWPTIGCEITLSNGRQVHGIAPTGASIGAHEARQIYDGGTRLWGRGVRETAASIDQIIAPLFCGTLSEPVTADLTLLELDGTHDMSHLGANVTLACSIALYRAYAEALEIPLYHLCAHTADYQTASLPTPLFNVINGGAHAHSNLVFQEFMIMPVEVSSFAHALEAGVTVYHLLSQYLSQHMPYLCVGDEGGFVSAFEHEEEALDILHTVLQKAHQQHGISCVLALDIAASEFFDARRQRYTIRETSYTHNELIAWYQELTERYPIVMLEDPLAEHEEAGWHKLYHELDVHIIGDDLCVTDPHRIAQAAHRNWITASIIKPNQIGTMTQALQSMQVCHEHDIVSIASHRSGDTEDTSIADLAIAGHAQFIKAGAPCRSERVAKYNRLLEIERHLTQTSS